MTKIICFLLAFPSVSYATELGQLAPRKAQEFLRTGAVASELSEAANESDYENLSRALELGLSIQKFGNESFIYDLGALEFITEGIESRATDLQKKIYSFSCDLVQVSRTSETLDTNAYSDIFQMMGTMRFAARLALLGHQTEAVKLVNFMQTNLDQSKKTAQWLDVSGSLRQIRSTFSNSGRPIGPKAVLNALALINQI